MLLCLGAFVAIVFCHTVFLIEVSIFNELFFSRQSDEMILLQPLHVDPAHGVQHQWHLLDGNK